MAKRKHTAEEIINKLREAEVVIAAGSTVAEAARRIGVSERTFHRWKAEYGGLRVDQARCLKQLSETSVPRPSPPMCPASEGDLWESQSGGHARRWGSPARPIVMSRWPGMTRCTLTNSRLNSRMRWPVSCSRDPRGVGLRP